jgi:hypothetical protein
MIPMTHTIFPLLLAAVLSFQIPSLAQSTPQGPLAHALVGEWSNLYLRITMNNGSVMEADSSNWETRLGIKPIHTFFKADGSYYSEYRNLQDSLVRRPSGTWIIEGDSLSMNEATPQTAVYKFKLEITADIATFSGLIDFDGDGTRDELYFGRQRKKATNL